MKRLIHLLDFCRPACTWAAHLWQRLTEPHRFIHNIEERRKVRLLASMMLILLLFGLAAAGLGWIPSGSYFLLLTVAAAYLMSTRPRGYFLVARLVVGLFTLTIFQAMTLVDAPFSFLYSMMIPLILSAILLTEWETLLLSLVVIVSHFVVIDLNPTVVFDPIQVWVVGLICVSLQVYMRHRDALEKDRQTELQARLSQVETANTELGREIQERTRAEKALSVERNLLQTIIEHVPDYIFSKDAEGHYTSSSSASARLFGVRLPPDKFVGKTSVEAFNEPYGQQIFDDDMLVIHSERPLLDVERRIQDVGGDEHWVQSSKIPLHDDSGRVIGLVGITRDITERKRAEEELARSRAILRLVLDSIPDYVIWKDTHSIYQGCNRVFANMVGLPSPDAVAGKRDEDFIGRLPGKVNQYRREDDLILSGQASTIRYEEEFRSEEGRVFWSVTKVPLKDKQDEIIGVLGVVTDMTIQKAAQEELEQLNAQLEQRVSERTQQLQAANAELEAFAYSVSHDLRAPLRAIDGFSQAFLEDYGSQVDATGQDYLRRVRSGTQRMGRLIDDLLQLSRVTRREIHFETVDLSAMAEEIAAELQGTNPERQVEWDIQPNVSAYGDAGLLRILLNNLLGNAWKFTSKKTSAHIAFRCEERDGQRHYSVIDDGVGFDPAYTQKLFGAFQRLHSASDFEGTGIGLATVRRIVNRHGGSIEAHSQPDQGATFTFTL